MDIPQVYTIVTHYLNWYKFYSFVGSQYVDTIIVHDMKINFGKRTLLIRQRRSDHFVFRNLNILLRHLGSRLNT